MDIYIKELKEKLDNKEDFILIDVREPHEHEDFNVGGQLIPVGSIPSALEDLAIYKEQEIVLYCRSGNRSGIAQQLMQSHGFINVRNLLGGMLDWIDTYGRDEQYANKV